MRGDLAPPLQAPKDADPADVIWSVIVVDPQDPLRRIAPQKEGIYVWAYKGRPVSTYARDHEPGDLNGTGCQAQRIPIDLGQPRRSDVTQIVERQVHQPGMRDSSAKPRCHDGINRRRVSVLPMI